MICLWSYINFIQYSDVHHEVIWNHGDVGATIVRMFRHFTIKYSFQYVHQRSTDMTCLRSYINPIQYSDVPQAVIWYHGDVGATIVRMFHHITIKYSFQYVHHRSTDMICLWSYINPIQYSDVPQAVIWYHGDVGVNDNSVSETLIKHKIALVCWVFSDQVHSKNISVDVSRLPSVKAVCIDISLPLARMHCYFSHRTSNAVVTCKRGSKRYDIYSLRFSLFYFFQMLHRDIEKNATRHSENFSNSCFLWQTMLWEGKPFAAQWHGKWLKYQPLWAWLLHVWQ